MRVLNKLRKKKRLPPPPRKRIQISEMETAFNNMQNDSDIGKEAVIETFDRPDLIMQYTDTELIDILTLHINRFSLEEINELLNKINKSIFLLGCSNVNNAYKILSCRMGQKGMSVIELAELYLKHINNMEFRVKLIENIRKKEIPAIKDIVALSIRNGCEAEVERIFSKNNVIDFILFKEFKHTEEHEAYQILELKEDATEKDIQASYRKLMFFYHPDRNRENPREDAAERLEEIKAAKEEAIRYAYCSLTA